LSIAQTKAPGKPIKPIRYNPSYQEGLHIRYKLNLAGRKLVQVSRKLGLEDSITRKVVCGLRRSARIELEIARLLGKADWNEVVLEARSEIQKKPIEVILREMEEKKLAAKKRMAEYSEENYERVLRLIPDGAIAQKEQERKAAKAKGGVA